MGMVVMLPPGPGKRSVGAVCMVRITEDFA